jgi:hypothetical protein
MTADLGEVGGLELQGDLHEHVGDVSRPPRRRLRIRAI